jgi:hydroxymethylpyrimidine pyrophosphatase-like HAD family hydrolase
MIIEDVEQLSAKPVTRIILRDPTRSDQDFVGLARQLGLDGVTYFVGWSAWLDIAPAGVNKATALAEVAAGLGISAADVLAFGDGRNDIEMLRWAGRGCGDRGRPGRGAGGRGRRQRPFEDGGPVFELRRWFS